MNIQELIEILEKVEDKSYEIYFSYDSRFATHKVSCVDIASNTLVFRSEDREEYIYHNPNLDDKSDEEAYYQYYTECLNFYLKYMTKNTNKNEHMVEAVKYANKQSDIYKLDRKRNKKECSNHINLFLSDS